MKHEPAPIQPIIPAIGIDGLLFPIEKLKAHQDGTLHLAVSVFVFCGPNLLIQKRAKSKYHCGGLWANTCCTHPHWNEAPESSASRRLHEELGIKLELKAAQVIEYYAEVSNNLIEHERVQVFRADVPQQNLDFNLAPDEVADIRWTDVRELKLDAIANPQNYAPWFKIYLKRWSELGL
ncbi:isopentenyl-diphosphate Delta-isomerase [Aquidulcibacter paucihalophilus]|uniref:isopentenyl-diphosphate Delta-isomerase n=1 Tax=Aquidulcibacter paucihalophilus TaxID=1978549 RepID=UPI000A1926DB|nr:NUDIX domain-containing protein [Aquidulcibacter paucihalophilus]